MKRQLSNKCSASTCRRSFATNRRIAFSAFGRAAVRQARGSLTTARAIDEDEELDEEVAQFLWEQDASERGFDPRANPEEVIGSEEVDEEQAKAYCRDVLRIVKLLKDRRDMDLREAKLVLQIDDPGNDEARKMGIEDSRGVSRDEIALALEDVAAGKIPADRIALKVLHGEMINWPFLESDASAAPPEDVEIKAPAPDSQGEGTSGDEGGQEATAPGWRPGQARPPVGRDPLEKPTGITDKLPDWVGYGTLYAVTLIPVAILGVTVAILFFSSLK